MILASSWVGGVRWVSWSGEQQLFVGDWWSWHWVRLEYNSVLISAARDKFSGAATTWSVFLTLAFLIILMHPPHTQQFNKPQCISCISMLSTASSTEISSAFAKCNNITIFLFCIFFSSLSSIFSSIFPPGVKWFWWWNPLPLWLQILLRPTESLNGYRGKRINIKRIFHQIPLISWKLWTIIYLKSTNIPLKSIKAFLENLNWVFFVTKSNKVEIKISDCICSLQRTPAQS